MRHTVLIWEEAVVAMVALLATDVIVATIGSVVCVCVCACCSKGYICGLF